MEPIGKKRLCDYIMTSDEDIKRVMKKDATHKDTPIDRYNEPMYQKNASHRNTHHTRQGGRTDHSTSSHGLVPSSTDRVMEILQTWAFVISGYVRLWLRDTWEFIKIIWNTIR